MSLCYAALHPDRIRNLVTTVTPVDFHADKAVDRIDRGFMNVWARSLQPADIDRLVDTMGAVPGEFVGYLFSLMTPGRTPTKYNLDLLDAAGDEAKLLNFLRMERWLADRPSQPGESPRQWLKDLYRENKLIRDEFVLQTARTVRLKEIACPVLNIYTADRPHHPARDVPGSAGTGRHRGLYRGAPQGWPYRHLRQHQSTLGQLTSTVVDWIAKR